MEQSVAKSAGAIGELASERVGNRGDLGCVQGLEQALGGKIRGRVEAAVSPQMGHENEPKETKSSQNGNSLDELVPKETKSAQNGTREKISSHRGSESELCRMFRLRTH